VGNQIVTGVFTLLGSLLGVALGLFGERYIRERGKVRCEIDAWSGEENPSFGAPEVHHFEVNIYNEKDVALALWDIHMEVVPEDGEPERVGLQFARTTGEWVSVLNLPSRVAISEGMRVTAGGATLYRIKHARKLRFVGVIPGGKEFSKDLPRW
jgi:hypothetical protein